MTTSLISRFTGTAPFWPSRRNGGSHRLASAPIAGGHTPARLQRAQRHRIAADQVLRAHAAIVEFAYDALIGITRSGEVRSWNHAAERVFGYTPAQAIGRHFSFLAAPEQLPEQEALITTALAGRIGAPIETTRRRRGGAIAAIELSIMPIRNAAGAVVALAAAARDISARKQAEAHRALLAEELVHRVKNTLATVQSIAMHSLRGATSLDDFKTTFCARLNALSTTHTLLMRGGWQGATLAALVETELAPYLEGSPGRLEFTGPVVDLDPGQSLALGMMLHELATNAAKYGALSAATGRVRIDWKISPGAIPRLNLMWRENGGPAVIPPTQRGFGTRLITQGLARELGGDVVLSFPTTGVTCAIDVPLPPAPAA